MTLSWPCDLRFIRAVLVLSSQGSSTVQRHRDRLLFLEGLSSYLITLASLQLRITKYGINYSTKKQRKTRHCNCLHASIYTVLQRNEMWSVDFSWWIISFCTTALEFVCFALRSASIMICHLHRIDKCRTCWQWYKYLPPPWCFRFDKSTEATPWPFDRTGPYG